MSDDREPLGRLVRDTWVAWAMEQPGVKLSWLVTWDQLPEDDPQREVDMRIGAAVAVRAVADAKLRNDRLEAQVFALGAHRAVIIAALGYAIAAAGSGWPLNTGDGPGAWSEVYVKRARAALEALGNAEKVPDFTPDFIPGPETGPP